VALVSGMTMNFPETPETVIDDFREIGPSLLITASGSGRICLPDYGEMSDAV